MRLKRKTLRAAVALCCLFVGAASLSYATTINVPADYSTIQAAINASVSGDAIRVATGTYNENINFNNKDISLIGLSSPTIQGTGSGSVVTFGGSETDDCSLFGFTITNGAATFGGGINGAGCEATIAYCLVEDNSASYGGGICYFDGHIYYSSIESNFASVYGGGLCICGGSIVGSDIEGNETTGYGGGLSWCSASMNSCTISDNEADYDGGGLHQCSGWIYNCDVNLNVAQINGGGFANCDGNIENCTVEDNGAIDNGGGFSNCDGDIENCTIDGNVAGDNGGGMYQCWGLIEACDILANTAYENGAGIYDCDDVRNCTFYNNYASAVGGAIYNPLYVVNCDIYYNFCGAGSTIAAGVHATRDNVKIVHCTFARNDGGTDDLALVLKDNATSEVINCIFGESYNGVNDADYDEVSAYGNAEYCCFSAGAPDYPSFDANVNFTEDPNFVSLASDHHLTFSSIPKTWGRNISAVTYPGSDVDYDYNERDTVRAMGAFEYIP